LANTWVKAATGIVTGAANGLFGAGGGTILVPALEKFVKVETHKAHATALAVILPLSLFSLFFYFRGAEIPWGTILWISAGGVAGGFLGAKLLNRLKTPWLHKIFGVFMAVAAVRMIMR
jgi:uncharacterized membrane protein YfcA